LVKTPAVSARKVYSSLNCSQDSLKQLKLQFKQWMTETCHPWQAHSRTTGI